MKKLFLLTGIFFLLHTALNAQNGDAATLTKTGTTVPAFSFETEKGKTASINDYRGKVIWINFFATWCGPCRAELPVLHQKVWEKYKSNPAFALFVFGREESWQKVTAFKTANKFTFPMLPDEKRKIFKLFATQNIPRNIIIDKTGTIVYQSVGYSEEEFAEAVKVLEKLLGQ